MSEENKGTRKIVLVALLLVVVFTVYSVGKFTKQRESQNTASSGGQPSQSSQPSQPSQSSQSQGASSGKDNAVTVPEADLEEVRAVLRELSGEWNVEKYFNGEEWKIYKLGTRMAIFAYNFLNDYSYTTGGYNKYIGSTGSSVGGKCPSCGEGQMKLETGFDALLNGTTTKYRCDLCGYEEVERGNQAMYEYVPEERHEVHGQDIEYSTPAVTISEQGIDMTEMGGPVFSYDQFRVQIVNGESYLVNDACGFAFFYDGRFLEYCEPDTYGHFQGYYAYQ